MKQTQNLKELIEEAKKACRIGTFEANNKYDPKYFMGIMEDVYQAEAIIKEVGEDRIKEYFQNKPCSQNWSNQYWNDEETIDGKMAALVEKLESGGGIPMTAWHTDTRVRIIPQRVLKMYKQCLYWIVRITEKLNIRPNEKDCPKGRGDDNRYPSFGYAGGYESAKRIVNVYNV